MLEFNEQPVVVTNHNTRKERHGNERKLAGDISVEAICPVSIIDSFDAKLREVLVRERANDEPERKKELIESPHTNDKLTRRLPQLEPLVWDEAFPGYKAAITKGLGLQKPSETPAKTAKKAAKKATTKGGERQVVEQLEAVRLGILKREVSDEILLLALVASLLEMRPRKPVDEFAGIVGTSYIGTASQKLVDEIDAFGAKTLAEWKKKAEAGAKKHGGVLAWMLAEKNFPVEGVLTTLVCHNLGGNLSPDEQGEAELEFARLANIDLVAGFQDWFKLPWLAKQPRSWVLQALVDAGVEKELVKSIDKIKGTGFFSEAFTKLVAAEWVPAQFRQAKPEPKVAAKKSPAKKVAKK